MGLYIGSSTNENGRRTIVIGEGKKIICSIVPRLNGLKLPDLRDARGVVRGDSINEAAKVWNAARQTAIDWEAVSLFLYGVTLYDGETVVERVTGLASKQEAVSIGERHVLSASDGDDDSEGASFEVIAPKRKIVWFLSHGRTIVGEGTSAQDAFTRLSQPERAAICIRGERVEERPL